MQGCATLASVGIALPHSRTWINQQISQLSERGAHQGELVPLVADDTALLWARAPILFGNLRADRCAPAWVREWLQQHPPGSLASSTAGAAQGGTQAQASSADEALWEDLQANPEKWWEQCMMAVK